jgi:hypothetical protein
VNDSRAIGFTLHLLLAPKPKFVIKIHIWSSNFVQPNARKRIQHSPGNYLQHGNVFVPRAVIKQRCDWRQGYLAFNLVYAGCTSQYVFGQRHIGGGTTYHLNFRLRSSHLNRWVFIQFSSKPIVFI